MTVISHDNDNNDNDKYDNDDDESFAPWQAFRELSSKRAVRQSFDALSARCGCKEDFFNNS